MEAIPAESVSVIDLGQAGLFRYEVGRPHKDRVHAKHDTFVPNRI